MTASFVKRMFYSFYQAFDYGRIEYGLKNPATNRTVFPRHGNSHIKPNAADLDRRIENSVICDLSLKPLEVFTDDEIAKMKGSLIRYNGTHICILICLFAGLSQSEITALQWQDIDLDNNVVKINKTFLRRFTPEEETATALIEDVPNNEKAVRDVPIPMWLSEMLAALKPFYKECDYVLTGESTSVGPATFCYHYYPKFLEWADVEKRSFPALRNTYVKKCFESGTDVEMICTLLGYADINKMINRYFERNNDELTDNE